MLKRVPVRRTRCANGLDVTIEERDVRGCGASECFKPAHALGKLVYGLRHEQKLRFLRPVLQMTRTREPGALLRDEWKGGLPPLRLSRLLSSDRGASRSSRGANKSKAKPDHADEAKRGEHMRVRIEGPDGTEMEGTVIGGEVFDPHLQYCDFTETFTLRSDEGGFFAVHGWRVTTTLLDQVTVH